MNQAAPGTPTWLRIHNDRTAFRLFLEHGPMSRSQLGEVSGLSKPTAGQMIMRLERIGLIAPAGEVTGARGPNAVSYGVRGDSMTGVAISILASEIEAVLVDPTDAEHPVVTLPADREQRAPVDDVRTAVEAACRAAGVSSDSVSVVAVGVQAAVDPGEDTLSFTDTLPGWPQQGARRLLEEQTGLSVILENDVNLAAIAERAAVPVDELGSFTVLWVGEGLGVGVDLDGEVQRGAFGGAGEIGYLEVPRSAAALDPAAADFTDLLGGFAIRELLGADPDARLADALEPLARDASLREALAARLALAAAPIVAVLDPAAVVLGGPTCQAGGPELARLVQERFDRMPVRGADAADAGMLRHRVAIRTSTAGEQPILHGARRLLVDRIRDLLESAITDD